MYKIKMFKYSRTQRLELLNQIEDNDLFRGLREVQNGEYIPGRIVLVSDCFVKDRQVEDRILKAACIIPEGKEIKRVLDFGRKSRWDRARKPFLDMMGKPMEEKFLKGVWN